MKIMPQGDYYVWHCDWCDSRNHTLWTRIETGKVTCGVCFCQFAISPFDEIEQRYCIVGKGEPVVLPPAGQG
ncbi:MAG TPA: hypothetical protein VHN12_14900 [Geobacteraceae bacterium]|nr:hypothetical protein [Geobacteraceae bacterium]